MRIKDCEEWGELLIYFKDHKYPDLYGIIQTDPLILINEDGDTVYYPKDINEMVTWHREHYEDESVQFDHYDIINKKIKE